MFDLRRKVYISSLGVGMTIGIIIAFIMSSLFVFATGIRFIFLPSEISDVMRHITTERFVKASGFWVVMVGAITVHTLISLKGMKAEKRPKSKCDSSDSSINNIDYTMPLRSIDPIDALCQWGPTFIYITITISTIKSIVGTGVIDWGLISVVIFLEIVLWKTSFDNQNQS